VVVRVLAANKVNNSVFEPFETRPKRTRSQRLHAAAPFRRAILFIWNRKLGEGYPFFDGFISCENRNAQNGLAIQSEGP